MNPSKTKNPNNKKTNKKEKNTKNHNRRPPIRPNNLSSTCPH